MGPCALLKLCVFKVAQGASQWKPCATSLQKDSCNATPRFAPTEPQHEKERKREREMG